jgi:hypothetical protein
MEFSILGFLAIERTRNPSSRAQNKAHPIVAPDLPDIDYAILDWPPEEGNPEAELLNAQSLPAPIWDNVYTKDQTHQMTDLANRDDARAYAMETQMISVANDSSIVQGLNNLS